MTTPGNYPLQIYRGDSYTWQFKLWLDSSKLQPLDLTDVVAKSEIRDKSAGSTVNELTCSIVLPNIVTVTLSATLSAALPDMAQVWDLQLTFPDGNVNTIVAGKVTMIGDVTDSAPVALMSMAAPMTMAAPTSMSAPAPAPTTVAPQILRAPRITATQRK